MVVVCSREQPAKTHSIINVANFMVTPWVLGESELIGSASHYVLDQNNCGADPLCPTSFQNGSSVKSRAKKI